MKKLKPTKAFLFDFDGTLVDTMHGYADIAGRLISAHHPEISFADARRKYIETSGIPFIQQMELICPDNAMNAETVRMFEEEKIEGFFASHVEADVSGTIAELRARGFLAGVSSGNYSDLINRYVAREGVVFDTVMGYDHDAQFEKGKPHFDFFLKEFSLEKKDLTFVGDSLKDADKGYEYGCQFVGVCGLFSHEDFAKNHPDVITVNHIKELLDLV